MGSFLGSLFVDPDALAKGPFGFIQVLYLGITYGFVLMLGSNMIKDGSELLLLVPAYAGVVGSIVLPVLGAVPDGAIVLFSGLGKDAQQQVSVGVGALAGSTIMLLTIPWCLTIFAGRVNLDANGQGSYVRPRGAPHWAKLSPPNAVWGTGVNAGTVIRYTAKIMLITALPFFVIQIPAIKYECLQTRFERMCRSTPNAALYGGILATLLFCFYLWDQARMANNDIVKEDKIDQIRAKNVGKLVSIRGLFPEQVMDVHGTIPIAADNPRFQQFLKPIFRRFDIDKSGEIDVTEFGAVLKELGERPSEEALTEMIKSIDKDKSGTVSFQEFSEAMVDLLKYQPSKKTADMPVFEENGEDVEEEEVEMPDDLAQLSPKEQQKRLMIRSFTTMGIGVALVLLFADPMVDIMSNVGKRLDISPFFIAFIFAPVASNASELIAAYYYALKKTEKTVTIALSTLLGAACMNNTFCLAIFLFLIYVRHLKWTFSAETLSILTVELIMFFVARKRVQTVRLGLLVLSMFPLAILYVNVLEAHGLD